MNFYHFPNNTLKIYLKHFTNLLNNTIDDLEKKYLNRFKEDCLKELLRRN